MKKVEHLEDERKVAKNSDGSGREKVAETIELNLNHSAKSCLLIERNSNAAVFFFVR
jgi:hypothetical protein